MLFRSSAVGNTSTATIGTSDINGIQDVNLVGGQVGTNTISGLGVGQFNAAATSVNGAATGSSDVNVGGIISNSGTGTINTAGSVNAIARLSNTVTASTVAGSASAVASSDAVGLKGYSVNIIGSGSLFAGGSVNSSSTATSVAGAASA